MAYEPQIKTGESTTEPIVFSANSIEKDSTPTENSAKPLTSGGAYTALGNKMDKTNPTGTGSLSLNRKPNTSIGNYSSAEGFENTASGAGSHAEGDTNIASALAAHAEGSGTTASGNYSHSQGLYTTAARRSQHVFGEANIADTSGSGSGDRGKYVEIVGNGTYSEPSNARTLDWSGNEELAGNLVAKGGKIGDGKNANYKLAIPDTTSWTADQTIATKTDVDNQFITFTANVATSSWVLDNNITNEFKYYASISVSGATADSMVNVAFAPADAASGNFSPECDSISGGVKIYAKATPSTTITVTIYLWGDYGVSGSTLGIRITDTVTQGSTDVITSGGVFNALVNMIYPVGSIYTSANSTSPATFLGGTWTALNNGSKVYVPSGLTTSISVNQNILPLKGYTSGLKYQIQDTGVPAPTSTLVTTYAGSTAPSGAESFNINPDHLTVNLNNYIEVYMWQRTA